MLKTSSFWDNIGQSLNDGSLTFERVSDLFNFLEEMDSINDSIIFNFLSRCYTPDYKFIDYDTLLYDMQNKGITKNSLLWIFSNLHDFDHRNNEIIMYSYSKDKHYWSNHKIYRSPVFGIFKNGNWNDPKVKPIKTPRKSKNLTTTTEEDFKILSDTYDYIAKTHYSNIPEYIPMGIDIVKFRKHLYEHYKINKYQFTEMLQRIKDEDRKNSKPNRINLFGGPSGHYHKDNWVEYNDKHYLLIEVLTEDHNKQMKPHR